MNEELMQFVWKYGLFNDYQLFGYENEGIQILERGVQNNDAGPDFFNSRIQCGNTIWIGNIEIHQKSSDWFRHGHHMDKSYNNVILQVVAEHDREIVGENGRTIPVMKLNIDTSIVQKYLDLKNNSKWIPCQEDIKAVDHFKINHWLGKVLIERLNRKSEYIDKILEINKNNWEETFYQLLARSFGFKVNADPFEWLSRSIPMKYLERHQLNLKQIEALLFGQAGFFSDDNCDDHYFKELKKEYGFLRVKFKLNPIEKHVWKFLRLRPSNFPTIRISQFAVFISNSKSVFSKIIEASSLQEIRDLFKVEASEYWDRHYSFGKISIFKKKPLGANSVNNILINTVIPIMFVYGLHSDNLAIRERMIGFMEEISAESNQIIIHWNKTGIKAPSAFFSQALIHLKMHYCQKNKCLDCGIGIEIIKNQIKTHS